VQNFNMIGPILTSLGCIEEFWENGSQGPEKEDFQKMKKLFRGIHPMYKCAKFQYDWTIFDFSRLHQSFWGKWVPRGQKGRFSKKRKIFCEFIIQSTSESNFIMIERIVTSLGFSKVLDKTHTHIVRL